MQERVYIHYGHKKFDKEMFRPIRNERFWIKPIGGLWASPVDAKFGWKDWNEREQFRECNEDNCFRFTMPDANIFVIDSVEKMKNLPEAPTMLRSLYTIDFEECVKMGYDAIELVLSADRQLYWDLYGWDCDSVIVMNPDKIKVCESSFAK